MTQRETLVAWLKDAYAMESALVDTLDNAAKDASKDGADMMAVKIREHVESTRRHAELLRECIERHGESTPTLKTAVGKITHFFSELGKVAADDKIVKNALQGYAAEHFEIACYRALIAAARHIGDEQTAAVCERILQDEVEMARTLEANLPQITTAYLDRQTRAQAATV